MILLLSFFNCFLTAEVLNLTTKTLPIKDSYGGTIEVI